MKLRFKEHIAMQGDVNKFVFTPETPLTWKPGQFIHYTLPHENEDDRGNERWFTITSAPFEKDIWITTRIAGEKGSSFKKHLMQLKPGDIIETDEPEGSFTIDDLDKEYLLIAGGIGITPFRSILAQLNHDGKQLRAELLYANRDEANIPFKEELEAISQEQKGLNITYFIGDNIIDEDAIRTHAAKLNNPVYYVSGPEPMVEAFKELLDKMGIDTEHAKFDYFPGYKAT